MFQRIAVAAAAVLAVGVLIGCASIIHGSKQPVTFESTPSGAFVEVTDAMGTSHGTCETPCKLDLKRKNPYKVTMTKTGFGPVTMTIDRKSDGWIWGNLVFGGIIGLIVDFSNGAAYKLSPAQMQVTLPAISGELLPADTEEPTFVLIDIDNLSPEQQTAVRKYESVPWPQTTN